MMPTARNARVARSLLQGPVVSKEFSLNGE